MKAARAALLIYGDGIPEGLQVLHYCGTKLCVRPSRLHVYAGTYGDNLRDGFRLGERVPLQTAGSRNGNSRLDEAHVLEIRELRTRKVPVRRVARRFGVSDATVKAIAARRSWTHI